jgi:tRNA-dihydrouridine synthase B
MLRHHLAAGQRTTMQIGPHRLSSRLVLAPMAGVTDRPFRILCRHLGAGLAISEMVSADPSLRVTRKSQLRIDHRGEPAPVVVQIAGAVPELLADAARYNVEHGAQVIDINMGCPAKKVCNRQAGSALLADEALVARILAAVVAAVAVPVTLKIRTGPSPGRRNAIAVARIAQAEGVAALAVHGRTRACAFRGDAEYDTITSVVEAVDIPVVANGDVRTPEAARAVLERTGAAALMIGRAAQGNPWIFREVEHFLATGRHAPPPDAAQIREVLCGHLRALHDFYGETRGVRVARKHLSWYCAGRPGASAFWQRVRREPSGARQLALAREFLDGLDAAGDLAA